MRALALVLLVGSAAAAEPLAIADVADAGLRQRLLQVDASARTRALAVLARRPDLARNARHLHVHAEGGLVYGNCCAVPAEAAVAAAPLPSPPIAAAPIPLVDLPAYNSRPGSSRSVVLVFGGATVSSTQWNNPANTGYTAYPSYAARPFDRDGDETTFSDIEVEEIRLICERVAEDLRPFDINVTTVAPSSYGPLIGQVLVTTSTDANGNPCPYHTAGGVAYIDVFGRASYTAHQPAWVYYDRLGNHANIAEAAAHEFGHNLGLGHDGVAGGAEYYGGHGAGSTSWGPIMGVAYGKQVTQWSRGEYLNASLLQDDLAIIAGKLTMVADDHGDLPITATLPVFVAGGGSTRTLETEGVISSAGDADLFRFAAGAGSVSFTATPFAVSSTLVAIGTSGSNLDLRLDLLDEDGDALPGFTADPSGALAATLAGTLPAAGVYHLRVRGAGNADPLTSGYSTYGSIGRYALAGTVPAAIAGTISLTADAVTVGESAAMAVLTVRRSFDATGAASVVWSTVDGTAQGGVHYASASGTLTWPDGDHAQRTIAVAIIDNAEDAPDRLFSVALTDPGGGHVLGLVATAAVTISDDDAAPDSGSGGASGGGGGGGGGGCGAGPAAALLGLALLLLRRRRS